MSSKRHLEPVTNTPAEWALIEKHGREHAALTQQQLERDGRIFDAILKQFVVLDAEAEEIP